MRLRVEIALFAILFGVFAYFHQGGGWNQNVRFSQVRAIVEDRTLAINDFSQYQLDSATGSTGQLRRKPIPLTVRRDTRRALSSLDISVVDGRIYPNKPPGTVLLALPAYAAIAAGESALGIDPDRWWPLTLNLYATTLLSVGVLGALTGVLFFRVSRRLNPDLATRHHVASALTLSLATPMLPYSTLLFDHVPVACLSLASFACLVRAQGDAAAESRWLIAGGLAAGGAVVSNYGALLVAAGLTLYAASRATSVGQLRWWILGGAPAALFLAGYQWAAFGSPWVMSTSYQHEFFRTSRASLLGVFTSPRPDVALRLLLSPTHGLLLTAPPLVLAGGAWIASWRRGIHRPEALLTLGLLAVYLLMNSSFYGWHGGSAFGPRYLIPVVPFLALPLARAFHRAPRLAMSVAGASLLLSLAVTTENPLTQMSLLGPVDATHVSANTVGVYEGAPYDLFGRGSVEARWNAFNLGEFAFGHGWLTALPVLLYAVVSSAWLIRRCGQWVDHSDDPSGRDFATKLRTTR